MQPRLVPLEDRLAPTATPQGLEFRVPATTSNVQDLASIGLDSDGDYVVAWESLQDGSGFGVYARIYDKNGVAQTGEFRVNQFTTGGQRSPVVAVDGDGDFVVAWESYAQDGANYGVYARRYDRLGNALANEFLVNTTTPDSQLNPAIAIDPTGDFVVAWQSYQGGGNGVVNIYFQRYDSAGVAQGIESRPNTTTADMQINPVVAIDATGDFAIAWQSYVQDGDGYGVYARTYNAAGTAVSAEFRASVVTVSQQQDPAIAMDSVGNFVVAWESQGQDGNSYGAYARRFNAAGTALTGELLANSTTTLAQSNPAVAMNAAGEFVVTWQSVGQETGQGYGIYARQYTPAGVPLAAEFHINTYTTAHQTLPAIASDANANFVVAWQSENQDGSNFGVYAQRYRTMAPLAPPRVQSAVVNDGAIQRSRVTTVLITFDVVVTLPGNPAMAFTLTGPNGSIALAANTSLSTGTNTIVKLTFSGPAAAVTAGSLNDGDYTLTVLAASVLGSDGQLLDGNGNGVAGDNYTSAFFRRYGDADGDRDVDNADFVAFRTTFGLPSSNGGFLAYFDLDGDGDVDNADFTAFRTRFGVPF